MSKILILAGEGAIRQVRIAYGQALGHIGFQSLIWHPQSGRPVFDVFDEFEPEIVMCGSWEIDRALLKNLMSRPHIKVILWGGNWGDFDKSIDYKSDTVLAVSDNEKQILPLLIKNNSIHNIFTYYSQRWANVTHNKWKELGLEPVGVPLAADLVNLGLGTPMEEYRCDVSFVGGYWPYKAININKFLIPLCYPRAKLKVKIFGYGDWPVAQYLGTIDSAALPSLFTSSCVNANVFEPLAQKYGFDVNERCYKILACGGFCLSEYCDSAENDIFTGNEVVFAKTPKEFQEHIRHFVAHPDDRLPYIDRGISSVKHNHNYFVRLKQIFDKIGIQNTNLDKVLEHLNHD